MGYIYKIYNDINNKVYIGQTAKTIEERWGIHLSCVPLKDFHLYRAMRKYGIEHFFIEMIEECDVDMLDDREIYWIAYYDSYNRGYNETLGGDGNRKYDPNLFVQLWNDGFTCKEIAEETGCSCPTVRGWLRSCGISHNEVIERRISKRHKKVYQYDLNANLLRVFNSLLDAKDYFQYESSGAVCNAISFHYNVQDSLLLFEEDIENLTKYIKQHRYRHGYRPVLQYDINGVLITTYNTIKEAAQSIGGTKEGIINVCKKRAIIYKNYLWKYENDDTNIDFWVNRLKNIKVKGVHQKKKNGRWGATIYINGKQINLGSYINKDDAIKARLQAEAKYFKESSPQKYLFEKYNISTKQND